MFDAIGQVLGLAVGVAISPVPIIAVILMLFSVKASSNSVAFGVGWLIGVAGAVAIGLAIGIGSSGDDDAGGWVQVVIGLLFLVLAVKQWRDRPVPGEEPEMPKWMAAIDDLTAPKALGLGFVLAGPNPKNLGLSLAAASAIGSVGLETSDEFVVAAVYVLIASVTILVPVIGFLVARDAMTPWLDKFKIWLMANNATVMAVLFVLLGAKVLGTGISGLSD